MSKSAGHQLSVLVDRANSAAFWGKELGAAERTTLAKRIAATHGEPGAYANTFALSELERKQGINLFTGERATSASARHVTGEEACRALRMLSVRDAAVKRALETATKSLLECLQRCEASTGTRMGGNPGIFCCGQCSVSVWRHITAGGFDRHEERLNGGMKHLKRFRDDDGRWAMFPFWYTLSALIEIRLPSAVSELRHAAALLRRAAGRASATGEHALRRREIARRALAMI